MCKVLRNSMSSRHQVRRGVSLALIAILLPVTILLCAFSVNVAQMQLARTELQAATDASARAAGRKFLETSDLNQALAMANYVGTGNFVAGDPIQFEMEDIQSGRSTRAGLSTPYEFTPSTDFPNAIRLMGRRDEEAASGSIRFLFPLFASPTFNTTCRAVSTQTELDIALVLDRSGSMAFADNEPTSSSNPPAAAPPGWTFGDPAPPQARWHAAVAAADAFLDCLATSVHQERVSLSTYSSLATLDVALTSNYDQILAGLNSHTQSFAGGATNIEAGIQDGTASLTGTGSRPFASKVVIVMTDGRFNRGGHPQLSAETAASRGITVFTITFSEEAERTAMIDTARLGGGEHFHAISDADLVAVFRQIARKLPSMITE